MAPGMSSGSAGASIVVECIRCSGVRGTLCEPGTTYRQASSYSALSARTVRQLIFEDDQSVRVPLNLSSQATMSCPVQSPNAVRTPWFQRANAAFSSSRLVSPFTSSLCHLSAKSCEIGFINRLNSSIVRGISTIKVLSTALTHLQVLFFAS